MNAPAQETLALPDLLALLEQNVAAEIENQTTIQSLLDRQLDILLEGGTERLGAILEEVERGIEESGRLDRERGEYLARVAGAVGMDAKTMTLTRIAEVVAAGGEEWAGRSAELRAVLARIQETNRKVSLLLRHSVLFIEDLLGVLLGRGADPTRTYDGQGRMRPKQSGNLTAEC